jgi:hypothetical protein
VPLAIYVYVMCGVQPFFMDVSYSAVHSPLEVPAQYTDQYVDVIKDINRFYYAGEHCSV